MELGTFHVTVSCAAMLNILKSQSVTNTAMCQFINTKIMGLVILLVVIMWSSSLKMKAVSSSKMLVPPPVYNSMNLHHCENLKSSTIKYFNQESSALQLTNNPTCNGTRCLLTVSGNEILFVWIWNSVSFIWKIKCKECIQAYLHIHDGYLRGMIAYSDIH